MSRHTPGPWTWRNVSGAGLQIYGPVAKSAALAGDEYAPKMPEQSMFFQVPTGQDLRYIMSYEVWTRFQPKWWDEMQEANARLIAATPDLYEAAKAARAFLQDLPGEEPEELAVLQAAIDKAENGPPEGVS